MYTTSRLTTAPTTTFISEPYYREYFTTTDGQGYAPTRTIYSDSEAPQPGTTYEGRFTTSTAGNGAPPPHPSANISKNNGGTPIYTKTVTAAGLTVDLPSPDSGIGADAITPRDQNNIQQVSLFEMPNDTQQSNTSMNSPNPCTRSIAPAAQTSRAEQ